jgi:hypothetical protein
MRSYSFFRSGFNVVDAVQANVINSERRACFGRLIIAYIADLAEALVGHRCVFSTHTRSGGSVNFITTDSPMPSE